MRLVGVIDLRFGRAVRARGGRRAEYAPVDSVLTRGGDALTLAHAYAGLGLDALYVADLDAIEGRGPQRRLVGRLVGAGAELWLDAGVSDAATAREAVELGAARAVIGLETLPALARLRDIVPALAPGGAVFSLDLRDGRPIARDPSDADAAPAELAERAVAAGVGAIVVLDLARVGGGAGLDLALMAAVRERAPGVELLAGGGVRDAADLARLADVGCDGALVASAFHDGVLGAAEVAMARRA